MLDPRYSILDLSAVVLRGGRRRMLGTGHPMPGVERHASQNEGSPEAKRSPGKPGLQPIAGHVWKLLLKPTTFNPVGTEGHAVPTSTAFKCAVAALSELPPVDLMTVVH